MSSATPANSPRPASLWAEQEKWSGKLIVIEGADGSGRSTHVALLQEWLESEGFAVATVGLRRSNLVGKNIDDLLAGNLITPLTLALMYATDFFDQLENVIVPALRSGMVVLADRYIYTLIARACVRGIDSNYLYGIYEPALAPALTFWLKATSRTAFEREFRKSHVISFWESGRDLNLSTNLFESFVKYQSLMRKEFKRLSRRHKFIEVNSEGPPPVPNRILRKHIAAYLGIPHVKYRPSQALLHLWR